MEKQKQKLIDKIKRLRKKLVEKKNELETDEEKKGKVKNFVKKNEIDLNINILDKALEEIQKLSFKTNPNLDNENKLKNQKEKVNKVEEFRDELYNYGFEEVDYDSEIINSDFEKVDYDFESINSDFEIVNKEESESFPELSDEKNQLTIQKTQTPKAKPRTSIARKNK